MVKNGFDFKVHSMVSGGIIAHISSLTKKTTEQLLMICNSSKTTYNVLSHTHLVDICVCGMGWFNIGTGVLWQKKQTSDLDFPRLASENIILSN